MLNDDLPDPAFLFQVCQTFHSLLSHTTVHQIVDGHRHDRSQHSLVLNGLGELDREEGYVLPLHCRDSSLESELHRLTTTRVRKERGKRSERGTAVKCMVELWNTERHHGSGADMLHDVEAVLTKLGALHLRVNERCTELVHRLHAKDQIPVLFTRIGDVVVHYFVGELLLELVLDRSNELLQDLFGVFDDGWCCEDIDQLIEYVRLELPLVKKVGKPLENELLRGVPVVFRNHTKHLEQVSVFRIYNLVRLDLASNTKPKATRG